MTSSNVPDQTSWEYEFASELERQGAAVGVAIRASVGSDRAVTMIYSIPWADTPIGMVVRADDRVPDFLGLTVDLLGDAPPTSVAFHVLELAVLEPDDAIVQLLPANDGIRWAPLGIRDQI